MQYLTKWRMQIAAELLTGSNINVASIAAQIGYESEAAFSRAFKKMIGVARLGLAPHDPGGSRGGKLKRA